MPSLEEQIQKVRDLRASQLALRTEVNRLETELMDAHLDTYQQLGKANLDIKIEEGILHEMTLIAYQETGNKKPAAGVGIRIVKEAIYEHKAAFGWALEHKTCLALDSKAYEALMKAGQDVPGTLRESVQATIAKEL